VSTINVTSTISIANARTVLDGRYSAAKKAAVLDILTARSERVDEDGNPTKSAKRAQAFLATWADKVEAAQENPAPKATGPGSRGGDPVKALRWELAAAERGYDPKQVNRGDKAFWEAYGASKTLSEAQLRRKLKKALASA
jgi:hypothetical protein